MFLSLNETMKSREMKNTSTKTITRFPFDYPQSVANLSAEGRDQTVDGRLRMRGQRVDGGVRMRGLDTTGRSKVKVSKVRSKKNKK